MKIQIILGIFLFTISSHFFAYGETYQLTIDDHNFEINYNFDGEILAMAIDKELTSLLIATENVNEDLIFQVEFSNELISAESNQFAVLVNGFEVDYDLTSTETKTTLSFPIVAFTEEIEIIGTNVIPEFPLGVFLVFGVLTSFVLLFTRYQNKIQVTTLSN